MKQQVNLEIMDFVEKQILPKYNAFGESHGLRHVTRVIRNSLKLVPVTGADIDMVYVIAAYHDQYSAAGGIQSAELPNLKDDEDRPAAL